MEAEKGENANKLTRKRPGIDEEKNQFNAEKSSNEEELEVVDISDEDEDHYAEGGSEGEEAIESLWS